MPPKDHDAILIDTSIFESHGLRLDSGILGTLKQFKDSPVAILIPDVIKNELLSHLEKRIRTSQSTLSKAVNDAGKYVFASDEELADVNKIVDGFADPKVLAEARYSQFVSDVRATEIQCDDFISINDVLKRYFDNEPPFSEYGKKKNEFPDAIVLLAVEAWADAKEVKVLAVSADSDWRLFCEQSLRIDCEEKLASGLDKFNHTKAAISFIDELETLFKDGTEAEFVEKVADALNTALDGFTPNQYAESQFYWEPEGAHGWFENIDFLDEKFRIVEVTHEWIVTEAVAEITVGAEGEFSLSVLDSVDKDYVSLDSVTAEASETFVSSLLITISGYLDNVANIVVEEVEVLDPIKSINFGTLELSDSFYE
ncbi:PIN domain-containing protein [Microbulbifer litoralis]|uniref:PIN domain-containing protein n=1 Tax=Microbulbifer litoralis TaxID=2933965 RepID=UPI0020297822|nr:PIN domain-containing protein [Microbulbifer sp. GX H0434]